MIFSLSSVASSTSSSSSRCTTECSSECSFQMSTALAFLRPVKNGSFLPPNCQELFGFLLRLLIRFEFSSRMLQRSTAFGLSLPRNNWQPFTPQKFSTKSSQIHTILRRFFFLQSCALWFVKMPAVTCSELKLLRNEIDK